MADYLGKFDDARELESEPYAFDFRNDLSKDEVIQSASFSIRVIDGVDLTPTAHLIGPATVTGTQARQRVSGLLPGVTYGLQATVVTNQSNTKSVWGRVTCKG